MKLWSGGHHLFAISPIYIVLKEVWIFQTQRCRNKPVCYTEPPISPPSFFKYKNNTRKLKTLYRQYTTNLISLSHHLVIEVSESFE